MALFFKRAFLILEVKMYSKTYSLGICLPSFGDADLLIVLASHSPFVTIGGTFFSYVTTS